MSIGEIVILSALAVSGIFLWGLALAVLAQAGRR